MGKTNKKNFNRERENFSAFNRDSGSRKVRGQRRKLTEDDLIAAEVAEMEAETADPIIAIQDGPK